MSHRWVVPAVLLLLAAPGVFAHGGPEDEDRYFANRPEPSGPREITVPDGYTGPGREPYLSYFEGVWLYGALTATPLGKQRPVDLDVDGDWIVWEDANRSDIYAFNIPAGEGFYIANDRWPQHHARVSDGVVVYEDHRTRNPAIYAYFLETGETRRLSNTTRGLSEPDIDYPLVTWLDDNITNPDVWAYSLLNNTAWNAHAGTDRDSDPIVVGDQIYWRTYRYNLWDIMGYDTSRDEYLQVTTDPAIQSAPFSNGEQLIYLSNEYELGWRLARYDAVEGIARRTSITLPDSGRASASGDALLRVAYDVDYAQLVVTNISNGASNHVSGNLILAGSPVLQERTIYAPVRTIEGTSLIMLEVSPFAFAKRPSLTVVSPSNNAPWLRPIVASGVLATGSDFTEPTTFTYRINDQPPQVIPPAKNWRFTLDPAGLEPGQHIVTVRATFREGPPVTASFGLNIPAPAQSIDVERAGPAFHAARVLGEFHLYVLDNPAMWVLIPILLVLLALVALRAWLWLKPRRQRVRVEYVLPDDGDIT